MLMSSAPLIDWRLRAGVPWETAFPPGARLFVKCRHALAYGLRLLARERGVRRVWVPAYLITDVTEAVEVAGLECRFYDIGERLEPRLGTLAADPGDALVTVDYFGLAQPRGPIEEARRALGLILVENCAHIVPHPASAVRVGTYGDIAVFSLRKLAPVPDGGILVVNGPRDGLPPPAAPSRADVRYAVARLGLMAWERLAVGLGWNILPLKDRLVGPALTATSGVRSTRDFAPRRPCRVIPALLRQIDWPGLIRAREDRYRRLAERLSGLPRVGLPLVPPPPGSVPQAMPILVGEPDGVVRALRSAGVEAMRWPPPHEQIRLDLRDYPGAAAWLAQSVLLPLGTPLTPRRLDRLVTVLDRATASGTQRFRLDQTFQANGSSRCSTVRNTR